MSYLLFVVFIDEKIFNISFFVSFKKLFKSSRKKPFWMDMLQSHKFKAAKTRWSPPPTSVHSQANPPKQARARAQTSPPSLQLHDHVSIFHKVFQSYDRSFFLDISKL